MCEFQALKLYRWVFYLYMEHGKAARREPVVLVAESISALFLVVCETLHPYAAVCGTVLQLDW